MINLCKYVRSDKPIIRIVVNKNWKMYLALQILLKLLVFCSFFKLHAPLYFSRKVDTLHT